MYDAIVLSGGASKGFAMIGAVQYLIEKQCLVRVKYYIGTSIGSVIAYLLALGYSGIELMVYICSNGIIEKLKESMSKDKHWYEVIIGSSDHGIYDYNIIQNTLVSLTLEKMDHIPTLEEMYNTYGKTLIFTTYNLTTHHTEYLNHTTHPSLNCLDALRMSCNLQYIFSNFIYNDCEYIDGGFVDNFPIEILKSVWKKKSLKMIGISITYKPIFGNEQLINKLYSLLYIPILSRENEKLKHNSNKKKIISLDVDESLLLFDVSNSKKLDLFSFGYNVCKKQL